MDDARFDDLTRRLTGMLPRRGLLSLAALALPGSAVAGRKPGKKPKRCKPACGPCRRCAKGKCKADPKRNGATCPGGTCRAGACACPAGTWGRCPAGQCCPQGQACQGGACGACPAASTDFCAVAPVPACGASGMPDSPYCGCVTSVQGATACSSFLGDCFACTSDAQCTTALGVPGLCLNVAGGCTGCETSTVCVVAECGAASGAGLRSGGRGQALRSFRHLVG